MDDSVVERWESTKDRIPSCEAEEELQGGKNWDRDSSPDGDVRGDGINETTRDRKKGRRTS